MITQHISVRVNCDHYRYDSAAITAGILMASAGNLGCHVELGPFTSERAARESCEASGWLVVDRPAYGGGIQVAIFELYYCPVHRGEAEGFWQKVTATAIEAGATP